MTTNVNHSTPIYSEMRRRLAAVRTHLYIERVAYGSLLTVSSIVGLVAAMSAAEALFNGSIFFRTAIFLASAAGITVFAGLLIAVPLLRWKNILRGLSEKEVAIQVGNQFPEIKDRLWNILDIFGEQYARENAAAGFRPRYSPELIDASFADLQQAAARLRFSEIVSYRAVRKAGKKFSIIAASFILAFSIPQFDLLPAAYRLVHCRTGFRLPPAFSFLVRPGNVEIVSGESVPVSISLTANAETANGLRRSLPKRITLSILQADISSKEQYEVQADSSGQFLYTLGSIRQSAEYFSEAEGIQSDRYTINVINRPVVRSLKVQLIPPPYSRMPEQSLDENIGDVLALPGTTVRWHVDADKTLRQSALVFNDNKELALEYRESAFVGQIVLRRQATYHVKLEDDEGFTNADPIEYKLNTSVDEAPTVSITYPGKNIDVVDNVQLPLQLKIHDDFGFTSLKLAYRLVHSRYERPDSNFSFISIPISDEGKSSIDNDIDFQWDISPMGLVPEDVVEYHGEVFDNDNVSGPKKGVSESYLLRLPSLDEVFADADKNQNDAIEKLDKSVQEEKDLKKDLNEISEELKKNQPLDWQKQKKAEETLKRYQELTKDIDEVSKSVDTMTQVMQKSNILSTETLQKYTELQQLMQQINSPEFQEAMKRMQEAMQNVSPDQLRQAMQQVQFSEEAFRQSIERTMELLKRIQVEQKMDEMVKRATELQKQQEDLQKETSESPSSDKQKAEELAQKQDDINKELANIQQQLAELRKKMDEFPTEMPMKALDKAEEAAHDSAMEQSIQQSSEQLRQQQQRQALQSQEKASKAMEQMSKRLSEMQEQMLSNETNEAMNTLRKAMQDFLDISQQQEDLKNESRSLSPNSEQFRENAEKQLGLQNDLSNVTNNLVALSQKSFAVTSEMGKAVGKAISNMSQAMNGLERRNGQFSSAEQAEAMASLNKAASLAQSSMDAMQQGGQGGAGGSLLQQLRRMAGQQESINLQTEQLSQAGGLSQEQMQQMGRLAQQQDAVRKSMEELNKEAQESQDKNRILGDLQKIADEMKEVVGNLQQNNVNPNTIKQQQKILSRMLDAQTSMRERDFEQRRTSTAGTTPVRQSPAEVQVVSAQSQLREDLLKAMEEGYSKDYQDLIRKYYDALDKTQVK
ncbi:MAG: DUF4175 family protein [Bacteroidota bacterium]